MGLQTHLPIEILDYIQTHEPNEDVYGISQRELAKALGYHPCSMSRPLGSLVSSGLLTTGRGLVRDGQRRQLTYRLTPAGRHHLRQETRDVPLLSGETPPPPNPFLGRKEELEQLAGYWGEGGSVTVVTGPAGMGKTALLSRYLRRTREGRVPFWYATRAANSPRQFVSALAHSLSSLGKPQLAYYAQLPRAPLPRECADLAARALEGRAFAAVVDDVHLAGADLRAFLAEFVAALVSRGGHRFFLVGQGPFEMNLRDVPIHQLTIGGLDRNAAYELTNREGGLAERFESIYQSTLGSPLLLKLALARAETTSESFDLPAAVMGQLRAPELRAILPAAVSNEPLPAAFLLEDRALTAARIKELATIGVLQLGLHDRVEVLQALRGAVLARVEPGDEREAHRRLARFYSRSHRAETLRERFLHLVGGEEWKAAAELLEAHERDMLRLGYSDVLRASVRSLVTALPAGPSKVRVYLTEATMLRQHADYNEAILSYRRAITHAQDDGKTHREALLAIVDLHLKLSQPDLAAREFEQAERIHSSSRRLDALVMLTRARLAEGRGDASVAAQQYQQAFELARRARAQDVASDSIASWSKFAELTSGPDVALELVREALPGARQSGRMDLVFNLRLARARAYSDTGRQDLAEAEVEATRSEAESLGYLTQLTYALSGLAAVATERGEWAKCAAYARQACDLAERLGNGLVLGHTLGLLCSSEFRQAYFGGNSRLLYEAVEHGNRGVEVLSRLPPSDSLVYAHAYLTEAYVFMKRADEAARHFDRAMQLARDLGLEVLRQRLEEELAAKVQALRDGQPVGTVS